MWRFIPGGTWVFQALVVVLGAGTDPGGCRAPAEEKTEPPPPKVEETVGDLAMVLQGSEVKVEGVGLVAGLENTGADPPPSWYRSQLVDEMSKAGVEHASKLLADTQFSMVIVKMTIHAGSSPQDRFDVEVEVPPACGTKSLAGGYLHGHPASRGDDRRWRRTNRNRDGHCPGAGHDRQRQEAQ